MPDLCKKVTVWTEHPNPNNALFHWKVWLSLHSAWWEHCVTGPWWICLLQPHICSEMYFGGKRKKAELEERHVFVCSVLHNLINAHHSEPQDHLQSFIFQIFFSEFMLLIVTVCWYWLFCTYNHIVANCKDQYWVKIRSTDNLNVILSLSLSSFSPWMHCYFNICIITKLTESANWRLAHNFKGIV